MIASFASITIRHIEERNAKHIKTLARANCQIKIPPHELGTFEIRAWFPALQHDDAVDFHLFEATGKKYSADQLFVFKGESSFRFRPSDDGFFERTGDGIPMMSDMIAIFSQNHNITSVRIEIHSVSATENEAHFLDPYSMN